MSNNRIWTSLRSIRHKEIYVKAAKTHRTVRLSSFIRAWLAGPILTLIKNDVSPEQLEVNIKKVIEICKKD